MNRRPAYLTEREEQILSCIRQSIRDHGEGLAVAQLGAAVGLSSKSSVAYHLRNVEKRGVLVRDGHGWRTCRLR
ncbi:LexA family protein [Streptomyces sp. NPDC006285]|uniref:LexA family protein n=1 Tax=Streptomyces sp. NPDC006285 TaxID=3364742 RepID=UPI00368588C0